MLEALKRLLRDQLGLPPWLVLAAFGLLLHLAVNAALRKPLTAPAGLIGPVAVGTALEAWEIWHRYRDLGLFAPGNDPLWQILLRHAGDVGAMLAAPLLLVALAATFRT